MRPVIYTTYGGPPMPKSAPMMPPSAPAEHHVEGVRAHEEPERQDRHVAGELDQQGHAEREPHERERYQRDELPRIRVPARVESERQPRAQVEDRGQREDEGQRQDVGQDGDRDRRGAEAGGAED